MKFKLSFLFVFMLILTFVLVACNGDGGGSSDEASSAEDSNDEEQILVFARGGDSTSLDFASVSDGESSRVTKNIFESLLDYERDSFEIVPGLAHDWEVSEDGLEYTFYLEEDVKFHDGTDFNAEAVKLNFDRFADPEHEYAFADDDYVYSMYATMFG